MKTTWHIVLSIVLLGMICAACQPGARDTTRACIPPMVDTIPNPMPQEKIWDPDSFIQLPQSDQWQPIFDKQSRSLIPDSVWTDIAFGHSSIWVSFFQGQIIRYDTITEQTQRYELQDDNGKNFDWVDQLAANDQQNSIWALVSMAKDSYSTLAFYDARVDSFRLVKDKNNLFGERRKTSGENIRHDQRILQQLPDGRLLLILNGRLVSYDPENNLAQYETNDRSFPYNISQIIVAEDIVFMSVFENLNIYSYSLTNGTISNYGEPVGIRDILTEVRVNNMSLFSWREGMGVDSKGQVWVGYFSMLAPDSNNNYFWKSVPLSADFVYTFDRDYKYRWVNTRSIHQSSENHLLFETEMGLIQKDQVSGKSCWLTQLGGSVAEDKQGALWIYSEVEKQLFRFSEGD